MIQKHPHDSGQGCGPGVIEESGGRVRCAECGRWLRALSGHLGPAHDMTPDEYRQVHGIARTTPLAADEVVGRLRAVGERRRDEDPQVLDALGGVGATGQRARPFPRAAEPRRESTRRATSAARVARDAARLQAGMDAAGWGSLAEAVEWAQGEGVGWAEVARRLGGVSITPLRARAAVKGVTMPRRRDPAAVVMLDVARAHVAAHGDLSGVTGVLAKWLRTHRHLAGKGGSGWLYESLDDLDQGWRESRR